MEYKFEGVPRFMSIAVKEINSLVKYVFSSEELLPTEVYFLGVINENQGSSQLELSRLKGESKNLTVKYISALEAKGFVRKVEEGKTKKVYLSDSGMDLRERVLSLNDDICFEILSDYSEADIEKWIEMTRHFRHGVRDLNMDRKKKEKLKELYGKGKL